MTPILKKILLDNQIS